MHPSAFSSDQSCSLPSQCNRLGTAYLRTGNYNIRAEDSTLYLHKLTIGTILSNDDQNCHLFAGAPEKEWWELMHQPHVQLCTRSLIEQQLTIEYLTLYIQRHCIAKPACYGNAHANNIMDDQTPFILQTLLLWAELHNIITERQAEQRH